MNSFRKWKLSPIISADSNTGHSSMTTVKLKLLDSSTRNLYWNSEFVLNRTMSWWKGFRFLWIVSIFRMMNRIIICIKKTILWVEQPFSSWLKKYHFWILEDVSHLNPVGPLQKSDGLFIEILTMLYLEMGRISRFRSELWLPEDSLEFRWNPDDVSYQNPVEFSS